MTGVDSYEVDIMQLDTIQLSGVLYGSPPECNFEFLIEITAGFESWFAVSGNVLQLIAT